MALPFRTRALQVQVGLSLVGLVAALVIVPARRAAANSLVPSNFATAIASAPARAGYWVLRQTGSVENIGRVDYFGDAGLLSGSSSLVGMASTPSGGGYWLAAADGGVFTYGDARFFGSAVVPCTRASGCTPTPCVEGQTGRDPACALNGAPVVGIAASVSGGYWLAGTNGGVVAFGPAPDYPPGPVVPPHPGLCALPEDANACHWGQATVGISSTSTNMATVMADGEVRARGVGQGAYATAIPVAIVAPATGVALTPDGAGAWVVAADGGVFALNAPFYGSAVPFKPTAPIVAIATTPTGRGYWLLGADGGIFTFGDAGFYGAAIGQGLGSPNAGS